MFNFIDMIGNHESRKVGTYEKDGLFVDTCLVTDSSEPYETAIGHPKYNGGSLVIVEMYHTLNDAEKGHEKWVERMTAKELPEKLVDVSTSGIALMGDLMIGNKDWRTDEGK